MTVEEALAAAKAQPTNPYTWADLGIALEATGNMENARGAYQKALDLDPNLPVANAALKRLGYPPETPVRLTFGGQPQSPPQEIYGRVIVTDIDMPFRSMVNFIMKWTLATIPALILAAVLGAFLSALAWMLFGLLIGLMR